MSSTGLIGSVTMRLQHVRLDRQPQIPAIAATWLEWPATASPTFGRRDESVRRLDAGDRAVLDRGCP